MEKGGQVERQFVKSSHPGAIKYTGTLRPVKESFVNSVTDVFKVFFSVLVDDLASLGDAVSPVLKSGGSLHSIIMWCEWSCYSRSSRQAII